MAPTANVSFTRKVNLGNYESCDYQCEIVGVEAGMTLSEIVREPIPFLRTCWRVWRERE